ncbi:MAG TPA: hypothetical protein VGG80_05005 [Acidobacteriaceae bacterium]
MLMTIEGMLLLAVLSRVFALTRREDTRPVDARVLSTSRCLRREPAA